jgi:uncharacterized protein YbjT (DUF2867 family)
MILVVGATGLLGTEICTQLRQNGKPVRAMVRKTSDPIKVEYLRNIGTEVIIGDLKDPDSLAAACANVDQVVSTASSTFSRQEGDTIQSVDLQGQINLINAVKSNMVKQFSFISFPLNPKNPSPLADAKQQVERMLQNSGLSYTIIKANFFMEVWLSPALGFDIANGKARIYGDGKRKINWISFRDVASFAVNTLGNNEFYNMTIDAGGKEALSPLEVVQIFEDLTGNKIDIELIPEEMLQIQKKNAQNPLEQSFAGIMLDYANGWIMDSGGLAKKLGIDLTSVQDFAKR